MKKDLNFNRNVYVILIAILLLAVIIQVARSQYILQFNQNSKLVEDHQALLAGLEQNEPEAAEGPPYCIVYYSKDDYSVAMKNNAKRMLQYMQKPISEMDTTAGQPDYSGCSSVIVATEQFNRLGDIKILSDYVNDGGYAFFMSSPDVDENFILLYRKLGLSSFGDNHIAHGFKLTSNLLIGEKGLALGEDFLGNSSNMVSLSDKTELLAESLEGTPLLWRSEYGKGAFIVFNGSILNVKINRGIIAGAISLLEPDFIYPIFNSKIFFIDDFPAPIPKGLDASIYKHYKRDIPAFFRDIWWPDMLKAAKKYDVKYTAAIIQSYQDQVNPPFQSPLDEDRNNLITYGREVIKSGGEISVHGYNHQSLQMNQIIANNFGYKAWPNKETMSESIEEVLDYADKVFPNYTVMSYVPPSNVLGEDGREALKKAWPNLTVISSLYEEDETNMAYVQEFEIADDGIIEMPRISSDYFEGAYNRWAEANTMTSLGVFSHFIHPDDLLDSSRSRNLPWEKLYEDFTLKLARLAETYPWVRAMTSTEAALDMAKVLTSSVEWTYEANSIKGEVTHFQTDSYYILRSERKIAKQENCSVKKIDTNTYLVTAYDSKFTIGLGG